jgi:hypothetical protein
MWSIADGYVTPYEKVPILTNTDRDLKYSKIPASVIQLPDDRGIRQVSPMQDESCHFIRIKMGNNFIYSKLEADHLLGKIGFWVEGENIYYKNLPWYYEEVLMKLVADISDVDEDAEIRIPAGKEIMLMNLVLEKLGVPQQVTQDVVNDQNSQV